MQNQAFLLAFGKEMIRYQANRSVALIKNKANAWRDLPERTVSLTVPLEYRSECGGLAESLLDRVGVDAWALCTAELVKWIVSEAQAAAARDDAGSPRPEVDRQQIWRAGEGAPSDEVAISRIVHVTSEWAHRIYPGLSPFPRPGSRAGSSRGGRHRTVACGGLRIGGAFGRAARCACARGG